MWFSKIILSGFLAAGVAGSMAVAPMAEARPGGFQGLQAHDPQHRRYEVFYRHDHHDAWRQYGVYHSHSEADHAASHLRSQGYQVRVQNQG